jgi:hypothetical protein
VQQLTHSYCLGQQAAEIDNRPEANRAAHPFDDVSFGRGSLALEP